ncbi:MAG TPA: hypothetical protein VGQ83_25740 [Polyangia bacterium]|jgi:hypothetical protein
MGALALLLGARAASAGEPPPPAYVPPPVGLGSLPPAADVWAKHLAVMGQLGLGTPTGYYGLTLELSPDPLFVASLGVGSGSGPLRGQACRAPGSVGVCDGSFGASLQYAALGRFRVLRTRTQALALGGGFSMGGYHWTELVMDEPSHKSATRAYWLNAEVSHELRTASGFSLRTFAGYGWMLNPADLQCVDTGVNSSDCPTHHQHDGQQLFYLGVALGVAF